MSASDPISEKVRWALMRRLIEVLGEEEAETLMESLPPVVWCQLATKDDLVVLKSDVAKLKVDVAGLKDDVAGLKVDVAGLKVDVARLKDDVAGLKVDVAGLKVEVAGLKDEVVKLKGEVVGLKGEFALQMARMTRTMVFTFISVSVAMLGAMTAIVRTAPV